MDDTQRELLYTAIRNASKAGDDPAVAKLVAYLQSQDPTATPTASALTRLGEGVGEGFGGMAQAVNRAGLGLSKLAGSQGAQDYFQGAVKDSDEFVKDMAAQADAHAPKNGEWNVARRVGEALPLAIPSIFLAPEAAAAGGAGALNAVGQGVARGGIGYLRAAGQGVALGGLGGLLSPTTNTQNYGTQKVGDTLLGAATGGILSPLGVGAGNALNAGISSARNAARRLFSNNVVSPAQAAQMMTQALQNSGIDISTLPQGWADVNAKEIAKALTSGGNLDQQALVRKAAFDALNIKPLQGWVSRDPTQWSNEQWLAQQSGAAQLGQHIDNTAKALSGHLQDLQSGIAPAMDDLSAGTQIMQSLRNADRPALDQTNALYNAARAHPGMDQPIDSDAMRQQVLRTLNQQSKFGALPTTLRQPLENTAAGRGAAELGIERPTIRTADDINQTITAERLAEENAAAPNGNRLAALNIYKSGLDDATRNASGNSGAWEALSAARGSHEARMTLHEAIPALRAAVRNPDQDGSRFMQQYIYNGAPSHLRALNGYLQQNDPVAWNMIRGQVLRDLRDASTKPISGNTTGERFLAATYNERLRGLEKTGRLGVLFSPREIQTLRAIGTASDAAFSKPQGQVLTGFAGAAKGLNALTKIIENWPGLKTAGKMIGGLPQMGQNYYDAASAMRPAPVVTPGVTNSLPPYFLRGIPAGIAAGSQMLPDSLNQ